MNKENLRAKLKAERQAIAPESVATYSHQITERLLEQTFWPKIKKVHIYSSFSEWHEVETRELIKEIAKRWSVINITSPAIDRTNPIPSEKFDLVIIPTLAFDEHLNRIGLGGGWYDKFLITQPDALKVGLAFESGFVTDGIQPEAHDVALDMIVTEKRTLKVDSFPPGKL